MAERHETVMSLAEALGDFYDEEPVLIKLPNGEVRYLRLRPEGFISAPLLGVGELVKTEDAD